MAELFGFSITRKGAQDSGDTFTVPTPDDGSIEVAGGGFSQATTITILTVSNMSASYCASITVKTVMPTSRSSPPSPN